MRRRIKRRVFLMSMALATGTCGHAFAQGGRSVAGEGHLFAGESPDNNLPLHEHGGGGRDSPSSNLLGQVRQAIAGLGFGADARTASTAARGWRLELLQSESETGMSGDHRTGKAKPFGVALRVSF